MKNHHFLPDIFVAPIQNSHGRKPPVENGETFQVHRCCYDGFSSGTSLEHWRFSTCGATEEVIRSVGSRKLGHGIVEERHVEKCIGRGVGFFSTWEHGAMTVGSLDYALFSFWEWSVGIFKPAMPWIPPSHWKKPLDLPFSPRMLAPDKWRFVTNTKNPKNVSCHPACDSYWGAGIDPR